MRAIIRHNLPIVMKRPWVFCAIMMAAVVAVSPAAAPGRSLDEEQGQQGTQPGLAIGAATTTPDAATAAELRLGEQTGRMTVPVMIGQMGPFPFIIDTGAERTVISRELAQQLTLPEGPTVRVTAMTGTSSVATARIPSLQISATSMTTGPIEAPQFEAQHLGALGMLGIDTLANRSIVIDFDRNSMTVRPSSRRDRKAPAADEIVISAKSRLGQLVLTDARYNGRRIKVVIDTGTAISMGNEPLRRALMRSGTVEQQVKVVSVTGDALIADYALVERVEIGQAGFQNLPIAFSAAAPFRRFGLDKQPAVLLGMDALRLFRRVEIDFANREVRFAMPREFRLEMIRQRMNRI